VRQGHGQAVVHEGPIGQAGERVVERLVPELLFAVAQGRLRLLAVGHFLQELLHPSFG